MESDREQLDASHHNQRLVFLSPAYFCLAASRRRQAWMERVQKMGVGSSYSCIRQSRSNDLSDLKAVQITTHRDGFERLVKPSRAHSDGSNGVLMSKCQG